MKNQERDQIILNFLDRGVESASICEELDLRAMPTFPALKAKGVHRWKDGWSILKRGMRFNSYSRKFENAKQLSSPGDFQIIS